MKKTNLILLSLLLGIVGTLTGCGLLEYTVKYEITGPETVASSISYDNGNGGTDTINNVNIPWSHTVTVSGNATGIIGVSFRASGLQDYSTHNTYTAKIYVNGKEKTSSSSSSTFVSASYVIK